MAKKKIRDTDYLPVSARIRAMENDLLTAEQYEQLITAKDNEEEAKLLQSFGYGQLEPSHPEAVDADLAAARAELLEDVVGILPDPAVLDVFKIKYDYHNVKAMLKAEAVGVSPGAMLAGLGRVPDEVFREANGGASLDDLGDLPGHIGDAAREGGEILAATRDPQLSDIAVDRWCYRDLLETAQRTGSSFMEGYVRLEIDAVNLRTLVRTLRMGKNADFLRGVLFAGGDVSEDGILRVSAGGTSGAGALTELYAPTPLAQAAESGARALAGGHLTEFEKRCDEALGAYLESARLVPFGEQPVLAYLAALETEYTNLRIILMGRAVGVDADTIRARLRAGYV